MTVEPAAEDRGAAARSGRSASDVASRSGATIEGSRVGGRLGVDKVGESDGLAAVRAEPAGAGQAAAEDAAVGAALTAEVAGLALRALVDGGGLGMTPQKEDLDLVGRLVAEPKTALAASVRAPDPAPVGDEGEPAGRAGAFEITRYGGVTQRGSPPAGGAASRGL